MVRFSYPIGIYVNRERGSLGIGHGLVNGPANK